MKGTAWEKRNLHVAYINVSDGKKLKYFIHKTL